jgi:hypothetical protein
MYGERMFYGGTLGSPYLQLHGVPSRAFLWFLSLLCFNEETDSRRMHKCLRFRLEWLEGQVERDAFNSKVHPMW